MSGPGLRSRDSHRMIHHTALVDGEELTLFARTAVLSGKQEAAKRIFAALCDHWQASTLLHAEEEEAGWYRELGEEKEWQQTVAELTSEHEQMRSVHSEMKAGLQHGAPPTEVLAAAEKFLKLLHKHNEHEERALFSGAGQGG